jgi:two-component system, NtrC family, sensor kinase
MCSPWCIVKDIPIMDANMKNVERGNYYRKKIQKIIFMRVLIPSLLIVLFLCGTIVYYFASHSSRQVKNELIRTATDHRDLIDQFLEEKSSILKFIISSYDFHLLSNQTKLNDIFKKLQSESKAFFDLGIFDEAGNHLAYAGNYELTGKNYSQTEWFNAVKEREFYISDEFLGFRNIPHFIIAIKKYENKKAWYLRATIDTYFFNELVENIRIGRSGEAYLINKKGVLQTKRRSGGKLMEPDEEYKNYIIEDKVTSFSAGESLFSKYLYAAVPLKQKEWIMIVRQSVIDAYAPVAIASFIAVILIIAGSAVILIGGYIISLNIADQLRLSDIEKREIKTQLIIAGKLAEVGEMATGIAHEINNPLQVIKSETAMIEDILSDIENIIKEHNPDNFIMIKDSIDQISLQIKRCSTITHGLLNFTRETKQEIKPVNLQKFIPEVVKMVEQRAYVENIRIIQEIDTDIPLIMSDLNQLQQVFLNFFNNAIYALKGKSFGEIRIKTAKDNSNVIITIADNGCGFTKENMEKAFIPFFTTKPVGQGTGLGLSMVYGIIKGLGGDISLSSELNAGSVFTISLPIEA